MFWVHFSTRDYGSVYQGLDETITVPVSAILRTIWKEISMDCKLERDRLKMM